MGNERGLSLGEGNDTGGFNHRESFHYTGIAWLLCTFVMYSQWDSYHFKLHKGSTHNGCLCWAPLRGNVRFAVNVIGACEASSTVESDFKTV